jgi:hypothetical protein
VESFLVADFVDVLLIPENYLFATELQFHYRTVELLHAPYVLERERRIQVWDVAEQTEEMFRRLGDGQMFRGCI